MRFITNYKILADTRADVLENAVNVEIQNGWQPYGPLISDSDTLNTSLIQPMVKYAEEIPDYNQPKGPYSRRHFS